VVTVTMTVNMTRADSRSQILQVEWQSGSGFRLQVHGDVERLWNTTTVTDLYSTITIKWVQYPLAELAWTQEDLIDNYCNSIVRHNSWVLKPQWCQRTVYDNHPHGLSRMMQLLLQIFSHEGSSSTWIKPPINSSEWCLKPSHNGYVFSSLFNDLKILI